MYYFARSLYDGTVLAAYTIRKPHPRIMKRDGLRVDADASRRSTSATDGTE